MKPFDSINELHEGLLNKEYSVIEIVDSYLARIHEKDKNINSLITITEDYAYSRAKAMQTVLENNPNALQQFPLLGVPVTMKDMYLTKGIRTTAASKLLKDYVPVYSSTVFERLEAAGAILLGKANCDAWAHGSSGENSDFGPTKNPWNTKYVPGGSSSGSAASVAADFALVSSGTDTCGSIRLPANFCGLVGLKPTYGSVSRYGVIAMASSLDSIGHISRSAEDGLRVFNVTKGQDNRDATLVSAKHSFKNKDKLKIGIPKEYFSDGVSREVLEAVETFKKYLISKGHEIKEVSLPSTKYAISVYYVVQTAEVSSNLGRYDGVRYGEDRASFGSEAKRRIMLGSFVLSSGYYDAYYKKAQQVRTLIIREVESVFSGVDFLLAPVAPTGPFKLGEKVDNPLEMYLTDVFAATANLTGIPALAFPVGISNGMSTGVQLMGPKFSEELLYSVAIDFQKTSSWHVLRPEDKHS